MASPGEFPERRQRRRAEQSPEPDAAAAISAASVLGDRDLLSLILLRVGSPTWLVRAALTSKSWLRVASDPDFLDRFRALHPPRVLGLGGPGIHFSQRLLPVPQPPELAATARLADRTVRNLSRRGSRCTDYCNGRLLVESRDTMNRLCYAVASLLHHGPEKTLPLPPPPSLGSAATGSSMFLNNRMFLLEDDGSDAMSCLCLSMACDKTTVRADFSILQSGVWGVPQSAVTELEQNPYFTVLGHKLVSGEKVYMLTTVGILALDLATATFSAFQLPDGEGDCASLKFSRAKQSGLYVLCGTGLQLRVWRGDGAGQWVLKDSISVSEACAELNVQTWVPDVEDASPFWIVGVGDNAEFVILELVASKIFCCMQLGNRVVQKLVQGKPRNYGNFVRLVTMVWPPFFPALE